MDGIGGERIMDILNKHTELAIKLATISLTKKTKEKKVKKERTSSTSSYVELTDDVEIEDYINTATQLLARDPESGNQNPESEYKNAESDGWNQESGSRNAESGTWNPELGSRNRSGRRGAVCEQDEFDRVFVKHALKQFCRIRHFYEFYS